MTTVNDGWSDTSNGVQSELVSCMVTLGAMHPMRLTFGSAIDVPGATSPSSQWDNLVYACQ